MYLDSCSTCVRSETHLSSVPVSNVWIPSLLITPFFVLRLSVIRGHSAGSQKASWSRFHVFDWSCLSPFPALVLLWRFHAGAVGYAASQRMSVHRMAGQCMAGPNRARVLMRIAPQEACCSHVCERQVSSRSCWWWFADAWGSFVKRYYCRSTASGFSSTIVFHNLADVVLFVVFACVHWDLVRCAGAICTSLITSCSAFW